MSCWPVWAPHLQIRHEVPPLPSSAQSTTGRAANSSFDELRTYPSTGSGHALSLGPRGRRLRSMDAFRPASSLLIAGLALLASACGGGGGAAEVRVSLREWIFAPPPG